MVKINKLLLLIFVNGLLFNFTIFAPKLRPCQAWPTAENLAGIDFSKPLATEDQLKQLTHGCARSSFFNNKINCPACSKKIRSRGIRLHFLTKHSAKVLVKTNSIFCDVITAGKKCDYYNLQSTNVTTHKRDVHGFDYPTRKLKDKKYKAIAAPKAKAPEIVMPVEVVSSEVAASRPAKRARVVGPKIASEIIKFIDIKTGKPVSIDFDKI